MVAAGDDEPVLDRSFRGHKGGVSCLAFSPTTRQLASGSGDCSVMVWNFKPQLRAFKLEVGQTPAYTGGALPVKCCASRVACAS